MSKSTKRLGRGLDSLISNLRHAPPDAVNPTQSQASSDKNEERSSAYAVSQVNDLPAQPTGGQPGLTLASCRVELLEANPYQPRHLFDDGDIESLAQSIKQSGMLQPIVVRPGAQGRYQIVAGERRWRAAKLLAMAEVPVMVRQASDEQMLELALIENLQREDLNAIDRARAYDRFCTHFSLKPEEVAYRLGEDRTTVVNYLRLLDLSDSIQRLVAADKISMGHARCLLSLSDARQREKLAVAVVETGLPVRTLEEIVRQEKGRSSPGATAEPGTVPIRQQSAHLRDMERRFEEAVKTKVTIQEGKRKGSGRLVIEFYTFDDFDRLCSMLGVELE